MKSKRVIEDLDAIEPPRGSYRRDADIRFKWEGERMRLLRSRGIDGYAFSLARNPFVVEDSVVRIEPKAVEWLPENCDVKSISVKKQIASLDALLAHPLKGNGITCISSYPSDTRAKLLAANIVDRAIELQIKGAVRGKAYPLWHRLYGGFNDPLRDNRELDPCSMLVLTNIGPDSTPQKLEKLRDLLERYDNIPKVVVVNGTDPVTFFAEKMRLPLKHAIFIDSGVRPKHGSILDI